MVRRMANSTGHRDGPLGPSDSTRTVRGDEGPAGRNASAMPDIQVVGRCAEILRLFSPARTSVKPGQLESELGMQRSTAHRYLSSLLTAGFLDRGDDGYVPGPLLVAVGAIALDSRRVLDLADPYLRRLASDVHETTVLSLWGGLGPVVARVVEDMAKVVHIQVRIGTSLAPDSAQGKVFLAFLDDPITFSNALSHVSPVLAEDLTADLDKIRETRLSVSTGVARGVRTLATPIFDRRGRIAAAMGVVGTMNSLPEGLTSGPAQALQETARALSQQLGWTDPLGRDG